MDFWLFIPWEINTSKIIKHCSKLVVKTKKLSISLRSFKIFTSSLFSSVLSSNFFWSPIEHLLDWLLNLSFWLSKISIGFLLIAVSSLSSYVWPIRSFTQTLITLSLIIWVHRFMWRRLLGLLVRRLAQSARCPDLVLKLSEIGRLSVPYQICGISCRCLSV